MKRMQNKQVICRLVTLSIVAVGLLWIPSARCSADAASNLPVIGALDYPLDKAVVRNPWLQMAGTGWPSMASDVVARLASTPSTKEKDHFSHWMRDTVSEEWLPSDLQSVPFLAGSGFVHVKQASDYRVRIREVEKPACSGSSIMTKAIVAAVEPASEHVAFPKTQQGLLPLLRRFLSKGLGAHLASDSLAKPEMNNMPPVWTESEAGSFLALYPKTSTIPVQVYAWTDGRILLISLYEDVKYGEGPVPQPNLGSPPVPREKTKN